MRTLGVVVLLSSLALTGCGASGDTGSPPFTLPVGATEWDTSAPAWYVDGTLHVGEESVSLGGRVGQFVLGATGAYWTRDGTLMFTSASGDTEEVADVGWDNLAVSADRSVFATVDQSRGPTDDHGTHVMQVAAFDARTGRQLYRTPDEEPEDDADLADLYSEVMPLLQGVSAERLFFDGATISLEDGATVPTADDAHGAEVYEGYAETVFPEGYRVGVRSTGRRREVAESPMFGQGVLSPDRSTIFDLSTWPTPAVVHDASTGRPRPIDAPWDHFTLGGWTDDDTFFGVAERIDPRHPVNVLRARRVVSCELTTLACTPVSTVISTGGKRDRPATFLLEGALPGPG